MHSKRLNHHLLCMAKRALSTTTVPSANTAHHPRATGNVGRMRAWQIHSYGDLGELQLNESARAPIISSPDEVLCQVHAASVNPIDKIMITGYGRSIFGALRQWEMEFPMTLGRDFSGTILAKGQEVDAKFQVGDEVYGVISPHRNGSHAEQLVIDETLIAPKPKHLTHVEAASILYAAMTAWSALFLTGELIIRQPRQKVLILGASGGVGTVAVQMLKSQGISVVGTCSENAIPLVKSLGADDVFDYRSTSYVDDVARSGKYEIILDCAKFGHQNLPASWHYRKFITLNSPLMTNTDQRGLLDGLRQSICDLLTPNIRGFQEGKSLRWGYFVAHGMGVHFIEDLVQRKLITPIIHKVFKFDELPCAFDELAQGHLRGKVVVDFEKC